MEVKVSQNPIPILELHVKILDWYEISRILMKVFQLGCIDSNFPDFIWSLQTRLDSIEFPCVVQ